MKDTASGCARMFTKDDWKTAVDHYRLQNLCQRTGGRCRRVQPQAGCSRTNDPASKSVLSDLRTFRIVLRLSIRLLWLSKNCPT